jgi:uridine kinase
MWHQVTTPASPEHVAAVVEQVRLAEADPQRSRRCGPSLVVAIDGPSGSGKTTLAAGVAEALATGGAVEGAVEVVHMDDLYPGWDGLARAVDLLASQVLEPIAAGRPAAHRRWSWVRHEWAGTRQVAPARHLVVEGCGASVMPAGAYVAVRVFVDADRALRMTRGLDRDGDTYRPHWERWAAQEADLFERDGTRARADLVIDTSSL